MGVLHGVMVLSGVIWIILAPFGIAAAVIILAYKSHAAKARSRRRQEEWDAFMTECDERARQRKEEQERKEREREERRREFQAHIDNCYRVLDEWNESDSGDVPTPEEMKRGLDKYRREIKHFI